MARENPTPTFRIIPSNKNYPGLTGLSLPDGKEIVSMGVGPVVEKAIMEMARDK